MKYTFPGYLGGEAEVYVIKGFFDFGAAEEGVEGEDEGAGEDFHDQCLGKGDKPGFEAGTITVFAHGEATDFLGDFEGVLGVFEGFGVGVLAVHQNRGLEIGVKAKLAQTEVKVEVFGRIEVGVVPGEVLGKEGAADHDAGVLKGVSGVHELVDGDVGGWKELFTGDMTVFVHGEALTANDNDTGVFEQVLDLLLEAGRQGDVIGVHAGQKAPFGLGEAEVEGTGDPEVGFVPKDTETGVKAGVVFEYFVGTVG